MQMPETVHGRVPGKLVKTIHGCLAFVPDPLPPVMGISWDLARDLSQADRSLSELSGVAGSLPDPKLLQRAFLLREAQSSCRMAGCRASMMELAVFLATGNARSEQVREVAACLEAMDTGLAKAGRGALNTSILCEMHSRLLSSSLDGSRQGGVVRRTQKWLGAPNCPIERADFIPPPPVETAAAMNALDTFLRTPSPLPPLVRLALLQYQFETVQPFMEGNGRMARMLVLMHLVAEHMLPFPVFSFSVYLERCAAEYLMNLREVRNNGKWGGWITFFLRGAAEQSRDSLSRARRLMALWEDYKQRLHRVRSSAMAFQLVDELFSLPAITVSGAAERLAVTPRAAQLNIEKLLAANILRESTGQRRNRVFVAPTILQLLESNEVDIQIPRDVQHMSRRAALMARRAGLLTTRKVI